MKKIIFSVLIFTTLGFVPNAWSQQFKKLPSDFEYALVKDIPGSKFAKEGSMILVNIRTVVNDNILFDSFEQNDSQPILIEVTKPGFNGDMMEGFAYATEGDSLIMRTLVDSVFKNVPIPAYAKSGDKLVYHVKMVSVKTKEEYNKEQKEAESKQLATDDVLIQNYLKKNKMKANKTASGLYYVITKKGSGEKVKSGQEVTVNYSTFFIDGTLFDSNTDEKFGHEGPFSFKLGVEQIIKGFDEGISLLNKGAQAKFIIPSPLAYGSRAIPGNSIIPDGVPANSILIFDVELLDVK